MIVNSYSRSPQIHSNPNNPRGFSAGCGVLETSLLGRHFGHCSIRGAWVACLGDLYTIGIDDDIK